jgi:RDD family
MYCASCGTQRPDDHSARFCPSCGTAYDPEQVSGVAYAGWWSRVGASLLDSLVLTAASIPIIVLLIQVATNGGLHFSTGSGQPHAVFSRGMYEAFGVSVVYWLIALLLYSGLTMRRPGVRNGQTLGKTFPAALTHHHPTHRKGEAWLKQAWLSWHLGRGSASSISS